MERLYKDQIMAIQILYFKRNIGVDNIMQKMNLSRTTVKRHTVNYERKLYELKRLIQALSTDRDISDLIGGFDPVNRDTLRNLREIYSSLERKIVQY